MTFSDNSITDVMAPGPAIIWRSRIGKPRRPDAMGLTTTVTAKSMNFSATHATNAAQCQLKSATALITTATAKLMKIWLKPARQRAALGWKFVPAELGLAVQRNSLLPKSVTD